MNKNFISVSQAVIMLFLCRMFNILTYMPRSTIQVETGATLISTIISIVILLLMVIPMILLYQNNYGMDVIDSTTKLSPVLGKILNLFCLIVLVLSIISTTSRFQYFMNNAVFPDSSAVSVIITMLIATTYAVFMGIEGIARTASIVFVFFIISMTVIMLSSLNQVEFINLKPAVNSAQQSIFLSTIQNISRNVEVILVLFLYPYIKGSFKKTVIGYILFSSIATTIIGLSTILILGDFIRQQVFPFYTMASIVGLGIFQRLDAIHMALWVMIAFIKISLYTWVAKGLMQRLMPDKSKKACVWVIVSVVFVATLLLSYYLNGEWIITMIFMTTIPVFGLGMLVPGIVVFARKRKNRGKGA